MIRILRINGEFDREYALPPWTGSMIRGVLGYTLKKSICQEPYRRCGNCLNRAACFYYYFFETRPDIVRNPLIARKASGVTKPYVLTPLKVLGAKRFQFTLNLFGRKCRGVEPLIVRTLVEMGRIGLGRDPNLGERRCFTVRSIETVNPMKDMRVTVYEEGKGLTPLGARVTPYDLTEEDMEEKAAEVVGRRPSMLEVKLLTPTMVRFEGNPANPLEAHHMIRSLVRKYSLLTYYHGDGSPLKAEQAKLLIDSSAKNLRALEWKLEQVYLKRYSLERRRLENMGPFVVGNIMSVVDENLWDSDEAAFLMQLLLLGQYIHVGTSTTFGCGQYVSSTDPMESHGA